MPAPGQLHNEDPWRLDLTAEEQEETDREMVPPIDTEWGTKSRHTTSAEISSFWDIGHHIVYHQHYTTFQVPLLDSSPTAIQAVHGIRIRARSSSDGRRTHAVCHDPNQERWTLQPIRSVRFPATVFAATRLTAAAEASRPEQSRRWTPLPDRAKLRPHCPVQPRRAGRSLDR